MKKTFELTTEVVESTEIKIKCQASGLAKLSSHETMISSAKLALYYPCSSALSVVKNLIHILCVSVVSFFTLRLGNLARALIFACFSWFMNSLRFLCPFAANLLCRSACGLSIQSAGETTKQNPSFTGMWFNNIDLVCINSEFLVLNSKFK